MVKILLFVGATLGTVAAMLMVEEGLDETAPGRFAFAALTGGVIMAMACVMFA